MALFRNGSRYTNGLFTLNATDEEFLILRESLDIPESKDDIFLTTDGRFIKRLDLLSQEVYGRPDLWWVIMDTNKLRQPLFDLQSGVELRIPSLDKVLDAIREINRDL